MQKRDIFVVTGRQLVDGVPRGAIRTLVVCSPGAEGDKGVRRLLAQTEPEFGVTTITGLVALEERAARVRETLACRNPDWGVVIDPRLQAPVAAVS